MALACLLSDLIEKLCFISTTFYSVMILWHVVLIQVYKDNPASQIILIVFSEKGVYLLIHTEIQQMRVSCNVESKTASVNFLFSCYIEMIRVLHLMVSRNFFLRI